MASRKTRSKPAVVVENVDVSIERWQAGTIVQETDETRTGTIGTLFNSLMEFLGLILVDMKTGSNVSQHYQSLESSSAALFFWGIDLDVSQGELDETLRDSPELRDTCLMVLASIAHFATSSLIGLVSSKTRQQELLNSTAILASLEQTDNILDQPYYPTYEPGRDKERLCRTLRTKIDNLLVLRPSLASPAEEDFDDQEPRIIEYNEEHTPEQVFINSVAHSFPQAASTIVTRLGKLNWERYEHMLRLQRTSNQQELEPSALEKARTIFHDSGLGSSAPAQSEFGLNITSNASSSQSAYAPSVISSRAEASHKRLPPLPAEGRLGIPFTCAICHKQVRYQRTKTWKKHIFDDILAYACPFAECSIAGASFQDRDAMMDHLERNHDLNVTKGRVTCPLCIEYSSDDRDALALHFARHMEEIALAILPSGVDGEDTSSSDASSKSETESARDVSSEPGIEDEKNSGDEDIAPTQAATSTTNSGEAGLIPGTEVCYHGPHSLTNLQGGKGILCSVTSVMGEGSQRHYEIRELLDVGPYPPSPAIPFPARETQLIHVPPRNAETTLSKFGKGDSVIALYPGLSTFHKAKVVLGKEEDESMVRLRFEGEDEGETMSVERRYVIPISKAEAATQSRDDAASGEGLPTTPPYRGTDW